MQSKFSDKDILKLLTGLKKAENNYPSDMIRSRRDTYIKRAAAMAILIRPGENGTGSSAGSTSGSGMFTTATPAIGKILEIALVTALIAETGTLAYMYRDRIREWINNVLSPRVEQVVTPPVKLIPPSLEATSAVSESSTETSVPTPSVTIVVTEETLAPAIPPNGSTGAEPTVAATSIPKTNPGNHYGNTPKPDQNNNNKDSKDSSSKNNNSNKK